MCIVTFNVVVMLLITECNMKCYDFMCPFNAISKRWH